MQNKVVTPRATFQRVAAAAFWATFVCALRVCASCVSLIQVDQSFAKSLWVNCDQLSWMVSYGSYNFHLMNKATIYEVSQTHWQWAQPDSLYTTQKWAHHFQAKVVTTPAEVIWTTNVAFPWLITNQHLPIHFIINHFLICMRMSNLNSSKHGFNCICDLPPHHFTNFIFCRLWAYRAGWVGRCWLSLSFSLPLPTWFIVGTSPGIR